MLLEYFRDIHTGFSLQDAKQIKPELDQLDSSQIDLLCSLLGLVKASSEVQEKADQYIDGWVKKMSRTDWEYWFQVIHQAKDIYYESKRQEEVACRKCGLIFKRKDLIDIPTINGYRPGNWHYGPCCEGCLSEFRRDYLRVCSYCEQEYYVGHSENHKHVGLCPTCYGDDTLKVEWHRLQSNLVRAKKENAPATLTLKEWFATVDHFKSLCAYCQQEPFSDMEHFVPIGLGGGTTLDNCVPSCRCCNLSKGNLPVGDEQISFWNHDPYDRVREYLESLTPPASTPAA